MQADNPNGKPGSEGNVRVVLRVRPLAQYELEKGCKKVVVKIPNTAENEQDAPEAVQVDQEEKRYFELDAVLDEANTQSDVYERSGACKAITQDLFKGYNCTVLAYGQTGAGKSFTMGTAAGRGLDIGEMDGIIPRACRDLFVQILVKCDGNAQVELSYLEVYNEEIRDLMDPKGENQKLRIRETLNGEVYVRGLTSVAVNSPADIGRLMEEASSRRVTASTKMNAVSSRSHAICVLKIKGIVGEDTKFQSKLTLVDLAGSERLGKTEATGDRAKEGISINKGLFVLGQVVGALAEQRPKFKRKPPFRDSKLTRLLQDSLGGNSRTIMIACCSPADFNSEESINTLRYATQARNIKNTATANVIRTISQEEALKLERENTLLKQQVTELQETIRKLTEDAIVTPEEMKQSMTIIRQTQLSQSDEILSPMTIEKPLSASSLSGPLSLLPPTPELDTSSNNQSNLTSQEKDQIPGVIEEQAQSLDQYLDQPQPTGPVPGDTTLKSMTLDDVFRNEDASVLTSDTKKSYVELEAENNALHLKLRKAQRDVKASVRDSAIELPALKVRVMMLEEELRQSILMEEEAQALKEELEQVKNEKKAANLAAKQLSEFMEKQKLETGFRGDEIMKDRMEYFDMRLQQKWVNFVVVMLASFKEQMRLLGDYFEMVVRVVDSPDILGMLAPSQEGGGRRWWGNRNKEKEVEEEMELRNRLLQEHIKFFNDRLLELEDEIDNRQETVESIHNDLQDENQSMEDNMDAEHLFHDVFSKKGEKVLSKMTELMTGPLFTLPLIQSY